MHKVPATPNPASAPLTALLVAMALAAGSQAQAANPAAPAKTETTAASRTEMGSPMTLVVNKSSILRLEVPAVRISVGNPDVADITPINSREIILLGKSIGTTNLIVWDKAGVATMRDIIVTPEPPTPPKPTAPVDSESVEVIKGLNKSTLEF